MNVTISQSFKKKTTKAIAAIVLFIFVYLLLFFLSIGLMIACLFAAFYMITGHPSFFTVILGGGLALLGVMIFYFLIKFLFQTHKVDRSNLTQITRAEEPQLFAFIDSIVKEVGTPFPSKIFISPEVNASVFYDSSFWSMFFPIKKSLHIGMGLVNTVTEDELKAILAHEFGHFSQKSMKVGSYVYNVNQIIYNMLYENDSFGDVITSISNKSAYISFFMAIAVKIVQGIQWILQKLYGVVNLSYLELSREMEFHADAVAANVTGYVPLKTSLLRMDLADKSYNSVISFYNSKISEAIVSRNIFEEQRYMMSFYAAEENIPMKDGLPSVTPESNRFNHSRLNIEDQWASHPEVSERIAALEQLNIIKENNSTAIATSLFNDVELRQEYLTNSIFENVPYEKEVTKYSIADFQSGFAEFYSSHTFDRRYNGYYDNKNPQQFDLADAAQLESEASDLFDTKAVDKVLEYLALQKDGFILEGIRNKQYSVATFDYEGEKYKVKDVSTVKLRNDTLQEQLESEILTHDKHIYAHFFKKAMALEKAADYRGYYERFFVYDAVYDKRYKLYNDVMESLNFTTETLPYTSIIANFKKTAVLEEDLKAELKLVMGDPLYMFEITEEMATQFNKYLTKGLLYFDTDTYIPDNLNILIDIVNNFQYLNHRGYYLTKRNLLNFQAGLF